MRKGQGHITQGEHAVSVSVCLCRVQVNATQNVEARICERLHIGGHISYRRLLEDLAAMGFSSNQVRVLVALFMYDCLWWLVYAIRVGLFAGMRRLGFGASCHPCICLSR